jgi:hypothetical protein
MHIEPAVALWFFANLLNPRENNLNGQENVDWLSARPNHVSSSSWRMSLPWGSFQRLVWCSTGSPSNAMWVGNWVSYFSTGCLQVSDFYGAPGMTRTCDLLVRSQTLYPTELRARDDHYSKLVRQRFDFG